MDMSWEESTRKKITNEYKDSMKAKIKDLLYKWLIQKDRETIRSEAYNKGYTHGKDEFRDEIDQRVNAIKSRSHWLVNPDDVLTVSESKIVYLNGEQLSALEIKELKAEAKAIKNMKLWSIMQETLRQKAIEKSVITSDASVLRDVNPELISGKMMIHSLGIMKSIVEVMDKHK